jgi:uncharacterized coiled-coil protein SlyX
LTPGLDCLQEVGVDLEQLNLVIDEINDIHSASNPSFQKGGRLRPFILACAATQIMYYSERVVSSPSSPSGFVCIEMRDVCLKLQKVVGQDYKVSFGGMVPNGNVHLTLLKWSEHIRLNFDLINLDTVTRIDISGSQLAAQNKVIQKFGDNVSALNSGFARLEQKLDQVLVRLETSDNDNSELRRQLENSELRNENMRLELELLRAQKQGDKSLNSPRKGADTGDKPPATSSPSPSSPVVGTLLPVSSLSPLSLSLLSLCLSLGVLSLLSLYLAPLCVSVCARALSLSLSLSRH